MKTFDSYEIHGVHEFNDDGRKFCEQVPDDQASFWTLYGHIPGEGAMAIGDFDTREHAEEAFQRITGIPFAGTSEVQARVRVMHAGPSLLEALKLCHEQLSLWVADTETCDLSPEDEEALEKAVKVIEEAEGRLV